MADGFAEIIKYGLIMDKPLFEKLETSDMAQMMGNIGDFNEIINSCIIHKSSIIMKDTYEVGLRRILNFGHTVGHAIEAIYGLSHGKAVALGMCFAVRLSERYYGFEGQISQKIEKVLAAFHLPSRLDSFSASALFEKIASDKKRENKHIHFVLLEEVGRARVEKLSMNHLKNLLEIAEKEKWMC